MSNEWTTRAKVKTHLGITGTDDDGFIDDLVIRSYKALEQYLGRTIKATDYTEYYDGSGTRELLLDQYPINSITSLYDDIDRDFTSDTLLDAASYVFYTKTGQVRLVSPSTTFSIPNTFRSGVQNIKITYNAGYSSIPEDLEMASIMHIAWLYHRSKTEGLNAMALGGKSETYDNDSIPLYIRRMLTPYKKFSA